MVRDIRPIKDLVSLLRLYMLFRRRRFDIVHTHLAKSGVLGRLAAWMAGVPVVVHSIHGTTFPSAINPALRRFYIFLERVSGRVTDFFLPVCDNLKKQYIEEGIGKAENHRVIHSGMDVGQFRKQARLPYDARMEMRGELRIGPDAPVLGYIANFEPGKRHVFAIEMMAELLRERPDTIMLFAGEGKHRAWLESRISSLGLQNSIRLLGYRTDIARILSILDVKVFTSLWEGLPQVLVQAALAGVPIVAFDVGCIHEVVKDGRNGYLVPVGDVDMLAEKTRLLLSDPQRRREMGEQGTSFIDDSWSIESMVRRIDETYTELNRSKNYDRFKKQVWPEHPG
jgi:glycosyltransferase involved in cell wall biosynthesis